MLLGDFVPEGNGTGAKFGISGVLGIVTGISTDLTEALSCFKISAYGEHNHQ